MWVLTATYLSLIDVLNLSLCSKYFQAVCSINERVAAAKKIARGLLDNKSFYSFLSKLLCGYFTMLEEKSCQFNFRENACLSKNTLVDDSILEFCPFKIYPHLFHCKRGIFMEKICCLCSRFFVDSGSIFVHIRNNMCLKKDYFNPKILNLIYSEGCTLYFFNNSVTLSVHDVKPFDNGFGIVFFESIYSPFSLHIPYLEISVRVFVYYMIKNVFKNYTA